jgi:hypothetical protein
MDKDMKGTVIDFSSPKRYCRVDMSGGGEHEWSDYADFHDVNGEDPRFFTDQDDVPGYEKLKAILTRAYNQAARGKGKDRHANGEAFEDQPILEIQRMLGSADGALFQAMKKITETQNLSPVKSIMELLGAIVYLAAAIIYIEENL